jgi:hypothetical protein
VEGEWPASLVTEIRVFGSYMRGALEPGDIDVAYEFNSAGDVRWDKHFQDTFFAGQDMMAAVRKSLRGSSRSISLTLLNGQDYDDIPMLLWRRGESLETAFERLESVKPDPSAGQAPRHHMTEAFEGLDRYLPRLLRGELLVGRRRISQHQTSTLCPTSGTTRSNTTILREGGVWKAH